MSLTCQGLAFRVRGAEWTAEKRLWDTAALAIKMRRVVKRKGMRVSGEAPCPFGMCCDSLCVNMGNAETYTQTHWWSGAQKRAKARRLSCDALLEVRPCTKCDMTWKFISNDAALEVSVFHLDNASQHVPRCSTILSPLGSRVSFRDEPRTKIVHKGMWAFHTVTLQIDAQFTAMENVERLEEGHLPTSAVLVRRLALSQKMYTSRRVVNLFSQFSQQPRPALQASTK